MIVLIGCLGPTLGVLALWGAVSLWFDIRPNDTWISLANRRAIALAESTEPEDREVRLRLWNSCATTRGDATPRLRFPKMPAVEMTTDGHEDFAADCRIRNHNRRRAR